MTRALPPEAERWSLTTLREKLIKIGAKVAGQGRYVASLTMGPRRHDGRRRVSGLREIRLNLAVGRGPDAESSTRRAEAHFNLPRGAIFGYHRGLVERASGESRMMTRKDRGERRGRV